MTTHYEVSCKAWAAWLLPSPSVQSAPLAFVCLDNSEVVRQVIGKQQHLDSSAPGVLCHGDLFLWHCFMVIGQDDQVVARRQRVAPEGSAKQGFGSDKDPLLLHCGKMISKEASSSSFRQDFTKQGLVGILPSASSAATPVVELRDSLGW